MSAYQYCDRTHCYRKATYYQEQTRMFLCRSDANKAKRFAVVTKIEQKSDGLRWFWLLTGGRPMVKGSFAFNDSVTGKPVFNYTDKFGKPWWALGKWSFFRVASPKGWYQNKLTSVN